MSGRLKSEDAILFTFSQWEWKILPARHAAVFGRETRGSAIVTPSQTRVRVDESCINSRLRLAANFHLIRSSQL